LEKLSGKSVKINLEDSKRCKHDKETISEQKEMKADRKFARWLLYASLKKTIKGSGRFLKSDRTLKEKILCKRKLFLFVIFFVEKTERWGLELPRKRFCGDRRGGEARIASL